MKKNDKRLKYKNKIATQLAKINAALILLKRGMNTKRKALNSIRIELQNQLKNS